ncbi:hypothetical protein [Mucilaginibacter sp.]|uniref:hypothetical protein n=1 Tax=Mucilaginibacter sp. TaxID=1882438 RepID=UPI00262DADE5|nr:hypothetical protein [Mucilaginibacter sp.]MDB5030405.1 hypothetical protein [Mucilaginibacter sp.]
MTQHETATKKTIRTWPIVVLTMILLLSLAVWYFYRHYLADNRWKPLLQAQLKELVLRSSDSLYHIEYSDFDLNITSGNATLSDFKLVPDTLVYQKLVAAKKAPDNLFILSVKKLSIKNVGARKAYQEKILNINNISIDNPSLTIINKRYDFNDTVKVGKPKTPYQLIKKIFKQLRIDSVSLKDISVNYINQSNPVTKQTALKHLDINISNVMIDSLSALDSTRFYYTKSVEVILHNYKIATPDSLYNAELKQIYFSTAKREIILDQVTFLPRYNRNEFYRRMGTSGDIFTLKFKKITIVDIDLQRFLRDQKLYAGIMNVSNANVQIYSNNAYKGKKSIKTGHDPHQSLQRVALDMKLSRLNIAHTDIIYSETDATTGQTGVITFNNTSGAIVNVTNDARAKKKNPFMVARIKTHFMKTAPLQVNFKFNLNAKNGAFNYSGTLGKFDGRILNKLVKPLALVQVQSADVERLDFNVDANNYNGKGHLEFYYKNLKVQLLKKVNGRAELQTQGFISKVANTLIIEKDNPDKKGVFRPGPINLKREPTASFFSFLYKGLLDGLKPSVGFDKKTENKVNKIVAKVSTVVDKFNKFKADRKQRKVERQTRRQAKKDSINRIKQKQSL